ncbi:hypothetical protein EMA8858_03968 [Emticicia aquatica]|uniref:Uncharacterized protein n=1 Tax=Emticicia aquatica TaxID=1681835 RepID=A0ABN8F0R6_9BACT|nr:hypothetical protein EMA8858_03968 [Emticicia aquatica]
MLLLRFVIVTEPLLFAVPPLQSPPEIAKSTSLITGAVQIHLKFPQTNVIDFPEIPDWYWIYVEKVGEPMAFPLTSNKFSFVTQSPANVVM